MQLLSGGADHTIRAQKGELVLWESVESGPVVALSGLPERKFAYATSTGTVGVYDGGHALWRIKSKHRVVSLRAFDLDADGSAELLTGWSSGKVDARLCSTGQVVFKAQLGAPVAGVVEADYRRSGRADLVVLTVGGEVRGYSAHGRGPLDSEPAELYRRLVARKQALRAELRQRGVSEASFSSYGSKLAVSLSSARGAVRLGLASGPGLLVSYAMVFAEGVFGSDSETLVVHPGQPQGELEISLSFPKNGPVDVHVKTCVGAAAGIATNPGKSFAIAAR